MKIVKTIKKVLKSIWYSSLLSNGTIPYKTVPPKKEIKKRVSIPPGVTIHVGQRLYNILEKSDQYDMSKVFIHPKYDE